MTDDNTVLITNDPNLIAARKLAGYVTIPTEMLSDYICPWRTTTAEERAEQDRQRAAARVHTEQAHAQLLADTTGVAGEVLTLHAPTYDTYRAGTAICDGCDVDGRGDQEQPYWPCRTYRLVAERHGRRFTSHTYGTRMETTRDT